MIKKKQYLFKKNLLLKDDIEKNFFFAKNDYKIKKIFFLLNKINIVYIKKILEEERLKKYFIKRRKFLRLLKKTSLKKMRGMIFFKKLIINATKNGRKKKQFTKFFIATLNLKKEIKRKYFVSNFLIFNLLQKNLKAYYFFRKIIKGRRKFIIPLPLSKRKQFSKSTRWLLSSLKLRKEKKFFQKFKNEVLATIKKTSNSISLKKKKNDRQLAYDNKSNLKKLKFLLKK